MSFISRTTDGDAANQSMTDSDARSRCSRKTAFIGASSASRSISLIGVTWETTSTVFPGYAATTRSRAAATRAAVATMLSPPGGATRGSSSQARSAAGDCLRELAEARALPLAEVGLGEPVVDRHLEADRLSDRRRGLLGAAQR